MHCFGTLTIAACVRAYVFEDCGRTRIRFIQRPIRNQDTRAVKTRLKIKNTIAPNFATTQFPLTKVACVVADWSETRDAAVGGPCPCGGGRRSGLGLGCSGFESGVVEGLQCAVEGHSGGIERLRGGGGWNSARCAGNIAVNSRCSCRWMHHRSSICAPLGGQAHRRRAGFSKQPPH
jgi:hypothetical protein